jgi:hypothetical protein
MSKPRPHFVLVTIWEHIEPIARGDRYEDPLYDVLGEEDLAIVGGGSSITQELGIEYVNLELELTSLTHIPNVIETLEKQGAPKGSQLKYTSEGKDTLREFGTTECLALFLDGVNLPEEVYKSTDIDELVERLLETSKGLAEFRASWYGESETSIHFFGDNADNLFKLMEPVLTEYPLCRNARVVLRHGNPNQNPREIRIPLD